MYLSGENSMNLSGEDCMDKPHEACGVFGIYGPEGTAAAEDIYYGLTALQHRGQESAGISVSDTGRYPAESPSQICTGDCAAFQRF